MERRRFLHVLGSAGMALGMGGCASALPLTVRPANGTLRIALADHPELARAGGSLRIRPEGSTGLIYLLALGDGSVAALSPICTHQGCTVGIDGAVLVCPCHGSTYTREGVVVRGPAERPLTRFPVRMSDDGELTVELEGAA